MHWLWHDDLVICIASDISEYDLDWQIQSLEIYSFIEHNVRNPHFNTAIPTLEYRLDYGKRWAERIVEK